MPLVKVGSNDGMIIDELTGQQN